MTARGAYQPSVRAQASSARTELWFYFAALAFGVVIAGVYVQLIAKQTFVFKDSDSAAFLEASRNLLAGRGLLVSTRIASLPASTEPLSLWPPGFPWILAGSAKLAGADPVWLAPRISWACWALSPAATYFALRRSLTVAVALPVAFLAMLAPGASDVAWQPMTDGPFLLAAVLSIGTLFRCLGDRPRFGLLLVSGLLAGLGYALRNAGIAVFAAVGVTFITLTLSRLMPLRSALARLAVWGTAAAIAISPVEIRNLYVFGVLQPYAMAPSHLGLLTNIRYFWAGVLNDIVAIHGLNELLVWRAGASAAPLLAVLTLAALFNKALARAWIEAPQNTKAAFIGLCSYIACGAAVVIAARTRFEWGEVIGLRYVWQYDWAILGIIAILLTRVLVGRTRGVVLALALIAVGGFRLAYGLQGVEAVRDAKAFDDKNPTLAEFAAIGNPFAMAERVEPLAARDQTLARAISRLPSDMVLVSNEAHVLRITTGRVVHSVVVDRDCKLNHGLDAVWPSQRSKVVLLLFPAPDLLKSKCWAAAAARPQAPGLPARPYLVALTGLEMPGPDRLAVLQTVHLQHL